MKTQEQKNQLLEQLKKIPIAHHACDRAGIGRATYYRWRKKSKQFAKQADEALAEGLLLINDLSESQLISAIKDKDLPSVRYWLNHHHPQYANRLEINGRLEHSQSDLTKGQKAIIRKALKLAGLNKKSYEKNIKPIRTTHRENDQGQASQD